MMAAHPCKDTLYVNLNGSAEETIQSHAALFVLTFSKSNCFDVVDVISGEKQDHDGKAEHVSENGDFGMRDNICESFKLLTLGMVVPNGEQEFRDTNNPAEVGQPITATKDKVDIPEVVKGCKLPVILKASRDVCHCGLSTVIRNLVSISGKEEGNRRLIDLMGFRQTSLKNCAEASVWTKLVDSSLSDDLAKFMKHKESTSNHEIVLPTSINLLETKLASPVSTFNIHHQQRGQRQSKEVGQAPGVVSNYKTDRVVVNKKAYKEAIRAYKHALARGDLSPSTTFKQSEYFISLDTWRKKMDLPERDDQNGSTEMKRTEDGLPETESRVRSSGQFKDSPGNPTHQGTIGDNCITNVNESMSSEACITGNDRPCSILEDSGHQLHSRADPIKSTLVEARQSKSCLKNENIPADNSSSKQDMPECSGESSGPRTDTVVTAPLKHIFVEGPSMTIADLAIFYPVHLYLWLCRDTPAVAHMVPHTLNWYHRMWSLQGVREAALSCGLQQIHSEGATDAEVSSADVKIAPPVDYQHGEGKSRKARNHAIKRELPAVLSKVEASIGLPTLVDLQFISLDWSALPAAVSPQHGEVPEERLLKKHQQIECLVSVVKALAQDSDTIVDFCSGGGHVGIVLAYLLPRCTVYMVENNEESLRRAHSRVRKLNLDNVVLYQSNIGYFQKAFNIGVSLHACGVATDIVIDKCLENKASFVSSPCCYGSINPTDSISHPRSGRFRSIPVTTQEYLIVAHAAEQTNWDFTHENSIRGKLCMSVIDEDRSSYIREKDYQVHLSSLQPLTCSPKNNLLVGLSPDRKRECLPSVLGTT